MYLYLVQHGEALPEAQDPARPLSPRGREETQRVAAYWKGVGPRPQEIWHSPKLRARQTAAILGDALEIPLKEVEGIAPLDDPRPIQARIEAEGRDLLLVSHLPFLSRLAGLLLVGDPERTLIRFQMSGVVALVRTPEQGWQVAWVMPPDRVPAPGAVP